MKLTVQYTAPLPIGFTSGSLTLSSQTPYVDKDGLVNQTYYKAAINADRSLTDVQTGQPLQIVGMGQGDPATASPLTVVMTLNVTGLPTPLRPTLTVLALDTAPAGQPGLLNLHQPAINVPTVGPLEPTLAQLIANAQAGLDAINDAQTVVSVTLGLIPPAVNAAQSAADAALSAAALLNIVPVANEAARVTYFANTTGNVSCRQLDTLHVWCRYNGVIEDLGPWSLATFNYLREVGRLLASATTLRPVETIYRPRLPRRPVITVICDDGYIQDLTVMKPIFDSRNVKAAFAACLSFMNSGGNFMTTAQILQLQSEGHTIMSHSLTHKDQTTYPTDAAGVAQLEADLQGSRDQLRALGFEIDHYVYPYTNTNTLVAEKARKFYLTAVGIGREASVPPLNSYALKRMQVTSNTTQADLNSWADLVLAANGWGIMLVHSGYDFGPAVQGFFPTFIDYARSIGVDFVSYKDGYAIFGNQLDAGDYRGGAGTVIDRDGRFDAPQAGGLWVRPLNSFNGTLPRTAFQNGKVTVNAFSSLNNAGLPCVSGTLWTDRSIGGDTYGYNQWNRQMVFDYNSDNCWQRRALTDTTWTDWVLVSNATPAAVNLGYNAFDGNTALSAFRPACLTVFPFNNGGNGTDKGYPPGYYAGTLLTYRTYAGAGWDYQVVKKYNDTESQMRTATFDGNGNVVWGNWVKITPTPLAYSFTGSYSAGSVAAGGSADIVISGVPNVFQGDLVTASRANKLFGGLAVAQVGCYANGTVTITVRNATSSAITDDTQQWKIGVIR